MAYWNEGIKVSVFGLQRLGLPSVRGACLNRHAELGHVETKLDPVRDKGGCQPTCGRRVGAVRVCRP